MHLSHGAEIPLLKLGRPMHTNINASMLIEALRITVNSGAGKVGPEGPAGHKDSARIMEK